ncbi:MAG: DUF6600 domain-containing protein [Thermoanaerobaculia bacterium]
MKNKPWFLRSGALMAFASALLLASSSSLRAQNSYGSEDEIRQAVARIAYVSGDVSFNRGDDPDSWQRVSLNYPMTLGDRVYTGRDSRMELQALGTSIYVSPNTDLAAMNLRDDIQQYSISTGTVSLRVRRLREDETLEIDTPNSAVTIDSAGSYRIDVDEDGSTRVSVFRGRAFVSAGGGEVPLSTGDQMAIDGLDRPRYDVFALARPDNWDRWVDGRALRYRAVRSAEFVSEDIVGLSDLDDNGRWEDIPSYGKCWSPSVNADWAPYRAGRWGWQDPWGWTWISDEPWGWAPYHYGRWVNTRSRWYWVPAGRNARVNYAPALVAFIGGPHISVSIGTGGGGVVGWFPLGPRDPFVPWWGRQRRETTYSSVRYVNQSYATVVNNSVFVTGQPVYTSAIRDRNVISRVIAGPVVRGPISIVPTRDSLRVSVAGFHVATPRPPERFLERPVVTRVAPPPAPPTFGVKEEFIRRNNGAPLTPTVAARLSVESRDGARAVSPVRPVIGGTVTLAPRDSDGGTREVRAVTPRPGRMLATPDRPIAIDNGGRTGTPTRDGIRIAPGAVVNVPASPERVDRRGAPSQPPSQPMQPAPVPVPEDRGRDRSSDRKIERLDSPGRSGEAPGRLQPGPGEGETVRHPRDAQPQPRDIEPRIPPTPAPAPPAVREDRRDRRPIDVPIERAPDGRTDRSPEVRPARPVTPRDVEPRENARPAPQPDRAREVEQRPAARPEREEARPAPEARQGRGNAPAKEDEKKEKKEKDKDDDREKKDKDKKRDDR